jgi:hypothetical protein
MKPPRTPEEQLRRVLRTAKLNGLGVAIVAGVGALGSLAFGDLLGAAVGALVTVGGAMELSGRKLLERGDADGMRRLVRSQLLVLGVIVVYAVSRFASFDAESAMGNLTPDMRNDLTQAGVDLAAILPMVRLMFYALYGSLAVVTLFYQGGLALYYRRHTGAVKLALAARLRPAAPAAGRAEVSPEDLVT